MPAKPSPEMEREHIRRLEKARQRLINARAVWERKASHPAATQILAQLDIGLELNATLLDIAHQGLQRLTGP